MTFLGKTVAGRFKITSLLGEGGMGAVYAAEHLGLGRSVALKIVHAHVAAQPNTAARFQREAQLLAKLRHENAVHVYDFGLDYDNTLYLAMELLDGLPVDYVLREGGPLATPRVLSIAEQVLDVLEVAHGLGVVHRDLKPPNLMLVNAPDRERVKVLDFGMAILVEDQAGIRLTKQGQIFGTPAYMAPEQCLGKAVDARTDLYALGCSMYEMLTGRLPFADEEPMEVILAQIHREPIPPRKLGFDREISPALEAVVLRAMAKLPQRRFPDARAMREALRRAAETPHAGVREERVFESQKPVRERKTLQEAMGAVKELPGELPIAVLEATDHASAGVSTALGAAGFRVTPIVPGDDVSGFGVVVIAPTGRGDELGLAAHYAQTPGAPPVLLCGPEDDLALMARSIEVGIHDYVPLPIETAEVVKKVGKALRRKR
jgi:eukaryotic-like serine/threonine-protein kinase